MSSFFDASLFVATNDLDRSLAQAILASAYDRTKVAASKLVVVAYKNLESFLMSAEYLAASGIGRRTRIHQQFIYYRLRHISA